MILFLYLAGSSSVELSFVPDACQMTCPGRSSIFIHDGHGEKKVDENADEIFLIFEFLKSFRLENVVCLCFLGWGIPGG